MMDAPTRFAARSLRRALALAGLAALTLIELHQLISVPAALLPVLAALMGASLAASLWSPWRCTLGLVVAAPLLIDVRRTVALATLGISGLEGVRDWAASIPAYPFLPATLVPPVLVWAWRALARSHAGTLARPDSMSRLAWLWGFVIAVGTVIGTASLNPTLSRAFWRTLAEDHWSWPMAPPLDPLHPLAAGHTAAIALLFFAMVRSQSRAPDRPRVLARAFVASAAIVAVVGAAQFFAPQALLVDNPTWVRDRRVTGLLRDPNSCGSMLASAFVLLLPALAARSRARTLAGSCALVALLGAALLMTGSRVAWFTVLVLLLGWLITLRSPSPRNSVCPPSPRNSVCPPSPRNSVAGDRTLAPSHARTLARLLAVGWLAALLWPSHLPLREAERIPFYRRFVDTVQWIGGERDTEMRAGLAGRSRHWAVAWSMIQERPWWGQGLGTFQRKYGSHQADGESVSPQNAHSQPLQTWAESGLAGLAVLTAIVALALASRPRPPGAALALLAFVLTSLTGHPLLLPEMQIVFWVLIALCAPIAAEPVSGTPALPTLAPSHPRTLARLLIGLLLATGVLSAGAAIARSREFPPRYGLYEVFAPDSSGVPFIWTRPQAAVALEVQKPFLLLPLRAGHPRVAEEPVVVTTRVGSQTLRREPLTDNLWHFWILDLRAWIGETVTLEIESSRGWSPAEVGSPDHRTLALALGPWEWLDTALAPDPPNFRPWPLPNLL